MGRISAVTGSCLLGALCLFASLSPTMADPLGPTVLPKDEAPHPNSWVDWWYFTGHLTGKDLLGRTHNYGFELTFGRSNALGFEPALALYYGNFAITDLNRGTFKYNGDAIGIQPNVIPPGGGYNTTVGTWNMQGKNGSHHMSATFPDLSYSLDLSLSQSTPAALHGTQGVIPYEPWGTSGYYSYTNLTPTGVIWDHGMPITVTGIAWHDHQWGDFAEVPGAWDWFSIQLKNGVQYMLYFIRDQSGTLVRKVGTKINPDGTTVNLDPTQISQTGSGNWTSPTTGNSYKQSWAVTVPGGSFTINSQLANQEVTSTFIPFPYWEGTSTVTGTLNGASVSGVAYVEQEPSITFGPPGSIWSTFFP